MHQLRCDLHGQVMADGALAVDPDLKQQFAYFGTNKTLDLDLVEVRYRLGYYDVGRVAVRANGVRVEGWAHLSALNGAQLTSTTASDDCLASVPEIDPRRKERCTSIDCQDWMDIPQGAHELTVADEHAIQTRPQDDATTVGTVDAGTRLNVLDVQDGWLRIAPLGWEFQGVDVTVGPADYLDLWIHADDLSIRPR
jgi:hypothetical protein